MNHWIRRSGEVKCVFLIVCDMIKERIWRLQKQVGEEIMDTYLERYTDYLKNVKNMAKNSLAAYRRDISEFHHYLREQGISRPEEISGADISSYAFALKNSGERFRRFSGNWLPCVLIVHFSRQRAFSVRTRRIISELRGWRKKRSNI